jgi:tagatose-6-phosphate ketose/aldose isomerase
VGAIECASKLVPELYNLVLVCNRNSQLALMDQTDGKTMIVNIPQEASDMGFAMTCSVSCMMMASWYLFGDRDRAERLSYLRRLADAVEQAIPAISAQTKSIVTFDYDRIVYLGFGGLRGLAHEGSIKSQELTSGRVVASYDTPTGFRHGPKTVIEPRTLTVHLISPIPLAQLYDVDLLNEIMREQEGNMAVAVVPNGMLEGVVADWRLAYNIPAGYETSELSSYLYGLLFLQMLSFEKSLKLGLTPDTPCPDGGVNRVVQGVTLHKLA